MHTTTPPTTMSRPCRRIRRNRPSRRRGTLRFPPTHRGPLLTIDARRRHDVVASSEPCSQETHVATSSPDLPRNGSADPHRPCALRVDRSPVDPTRRRHRSRGSGCDQHLDSRRRRSSSMTGFIATTRAMSAVPAVLPIRQCERCRLFAPLDDFGQPGALEAWRSCSECRDLVFPRPEPVSTSDQVT